MPRLARLLVALLLAAPAAAGASGASPSAGVLVIAGGAVRPDTAAIWRAFLDARPAERPLVLLVPAASAEPHQSAEAARETLIRHGASPEDVRVLPLALKDDPATADVDESRWAKGAHDPALVAQVARAGGIWFTGGDQLRVLTLLESKGRETPLLAALRAAHGRGTVIGGTSAGAAIMSNPMIAGGDPLLALLDPPATARAASEGDPAERLVLAPGLGFFPGFMVDQHFDARARLGRLLRATIEARLPAGVGIDEDTALVVEGDGRTARVAGRGTVVVIDVANARRQVASAPGFAASGLVVHIASEGDRISLDTRAVAPAAGRAPVVSGDAGASPDRGGFLAPPQRLETRLGQFLSARRTDRVHDMLSFEGERAQILRFERRDESAAWRGGEGAAVTVTGVALATFPARIGVVAGKGDGGQ